MAYAITTISAACGLNDTTITVASATSFAAGNRLLIDQEEMQVAQNYTSGTSVGVIRGQNGTATAAHVSGAGVVNGIGAVDFAAAGQQKAVDPPRNVGVINSVDITATGATGSTAAGLPANTPCLVTATGASGAGVGIPTGAAIPGAFYLIKNCMTGALNIYAVGGTINGTTGTTAVAVTVTGNLGNLVVCTKAGTWQTFGNT